MKLASYVARLTIRTILIGVVISAFFMAVFGVKASLSFAGGLALGVINGLLLKHWVEGVEGKTERKAKRAIRGGMAIRFLLIIAVVSTGTYFLHMDIVPFVLGLILFQFVGMLNVYKESRTSEKS